MTEVAMTTADKAVAEGRVGLDVFPVEGDLPKFDRKTGYRRQSPIEDTLNLVAEEYPAGVWVVIRQYKNKESANGTLYNLRTRHGTATKPAADGAEWDAWEFQVGDGSKLGLDEGITVLAARHGMTADTVQSEDEAE
jgi:hypothetical protein